MSRRFLENKSLLPDLPKLKKTISYGYRVILFGLGLFLSLWLSWGVVTHAQSTGAVQSLTGYLKANDAQVYTIPNLKTGETFYAYIEGTSGNLDPIIALVNKRSDWLTLFKKIGQQIDEAVVDGQDPLVVIPKLLDSKFLAWDDDGGEGYDATLEFKVPQAGDYQLLVSDSPYKETFGEYRLLLGLDAPQVLTGDAESTGVEIASPREMISEPRVAVETFTGSLTSEETSTFFKLQDFQKGDNLYVLVEAISGNLKPTVELRDFGDKLLRTGNFSGTDTQGKFDYQFEEDSNKDFRLFINGSREEEAPTTGEYRLTIGINAPQVLTGNAEPTGPPILQRPIPVQIGLKLQQITGINQKEENFGIVASLRMEYLDPNLAFNPDTCQCRFKQFRGDDFNKLLTEQGLKRPEFTIFNQQGRRWSQNTVVVAFPNGQVFYFERFTATLQAPDFDFRRYPLDKQDFFMQIDSILPKEFYVYQNLEGFSEVGDQLGEEEWIVIESDTKITEQKLNTGNTSSRFSFHFRAKRHLNYYLVRLFMPILIIILVSWLPFFLRDYSKRVDIASGNLLLFIAFNFTLSDDLPRLGYITFLDEILIYMFLVNSIVVSLNVYLRRLEISGHIDKVEKIDRFIIWSYPLLYLVALAVTLT